MKNTLKSNKGITIFFFTLAIATLIFATLFIIDPYVDKYVYEKCMEDTIPRVVSLTEVYTESEKLEIADKICKEKYEKIGVING